MMAVEESGVRLIADGAQPFFRVMDGAEKSISDFAKAALGSVGSLADFTAASNKALKVESLTSTLAAQNRQLALLQRELEATAKKYGESSIQADRKRSQIEKLSDAIKINEKRLEQSQKAVQDETRAFAESAMEAGRAALANLDFSRAAEQAGQGATRATEATEGFAGSANRAGRALDDVATDASEAGRGMLGLGGTIASLGDGFNTFEQVATGALRRVGEIVTNVMVDAGRAAVGFFSSSVDLAGDLEAKLLDFGATAGDSLAEAGLSVEDFKNLILDLGSTTQFSAMQAADGLNAAVKGGMDPATAAAGGLEAALNLAAAGQLELEKAAGLTVQTLGVWADTGATAADVTDRIAQAANASVYDVEGIGLGLANVGAVAKGVGASLDDVLVGIVATSDGFASAADLGTSYKTFLNNLTPTAKPAIAALTELGIITEDGANRFFDAKGNYLGLANAAGILQEATTGLSDAQRSLLIKEAFGSDAQRFALGVAAEGRQGIEAATAAMGAQGTAAEQAAAKNKGYNFAVESLGGSVENLKIAVGDGLKPALTDFINLALIPGTNALTGMVRGLFDSEGALAGFADAIKPAMAMLAKGDLSGLLDGLGPLGSIAKKAGKGLAEMGATLRGVFAPAISSITTGALPALTTALTFVDDHFNAFAGALLGVGAVLTGPLIIGALSAVGAALGAILSPIGLAIAAGAALGAAWSTNFLGIQEATATAWGYITEAFNTGVAYLSGVFGPVLQAFQLFGSGALQEITTFVQGGQTEFSNLTVIFGNVLIAVGTLVTDIIATLVSYTPIVIAAWWEFGIASWQWLSNAIPIVLDTLGQWVSSLTIYLANSLPGWIAKLLEWGTAAANWIAEAIPPMITKAGEFLNTLLNWGTNETLPALDEQAATWADALWKWIDTKLIPEIKPGFDRFLESMKEALKKVADAAWTEAKKIGGRIIDGIIKAITDGASRVWDSINSLFSGATAAAQESIDAHSPSRVFMGIGQNLVSGLIAGITQATGATNAITTLFDSILAASQQALARWTALLAQWGTEAWVWLQKAIPLAVQQASLWGGNLLTSLSTQFPAWVQSLMLWGLESWEWLRDSIPPLTEQMAIFHTALTAWASLIVLPALQTQATAWATTLYMWIPDELIPGILPMWDWFLTDSVNHMKRIEAEMYKSGKNVGKAIIKGTTEAIKDGKGKIINLFIEVINEAIAAAKRELGIASPSKVFYSIGENMMLGLQGGILSGAAGAAQTLQTALGDMTGSASATLTLSPLMAGAGGLGAVDKPIATGLNFKPVAPPATPGQIVNRASTINNSSTTNYHLTTNTARESQGVRGDYAVMQAFGR